MYGNKRIAAYFEILYPYIIVITTSVSRNKISINPYIGDFNPKNKKDHKPLSINWIPNSIKNSWFLCFCVGESVLEIQTIYKDKPIRKYSIIHTGPNSHGGGENHGLTNRGNQFATDEKVKIEPIIPIISHMIIEKTNLKIFLNIYSLILKYHVYLLL